MPQTLGKPIEQVLDGENNLVEFDIAYPIKGNLIAVVDQLRELHGPELYLLPMSATSCGGGIFQNKNRPSGTIVGLRFDPPVAPRQRFATQPELAEIAQDEIVIDPEHQQISAGSAITLDQLNQSQIATKTCLAGTYHCLDVRWARHPCGHAYDRQVEDLRMAVAGALYGRGH